MITFFGYLPTLLTTLILLAIGAFFTDYFNWWG